RLTAETQSRHILSAVFCLTAAPTADISTLSLHDALPISRRRPKLRLSRALLGGVHRGFGGDLRALITGGAFMEPSTMQFFYDLRSEEHTSELQSREKLVCRLLLEKKKPSPAGPRLSLAIR